MKRVVWLCCGVLMVGGALAIAQPPDSPSEPRQGRGEADGRDRRGGDERPRGGDRPPANPLIDVLDANRDRIISADEIKAASTALLKLDKNGDGQITEEEMRPERAGPREGGPQPFGQQGPRDDGFRGPPPRDDFVPPGGDRRPGPPGGPDRGPPQLDPARFVEHALEFDANDDGQLNRDELMKFAQEMANRRPPLRAGGPGGGGPGGAAPGRPGDRPGPRDDGPSSRPASPSSDE